MNGNAFGFPAYPQQPSVAPQAVGAALQQMQTAPQQQPDAAPPTAAPMPGGPPFGAVPSSAANQDPDPNPAIQLAVREAMDRLKNGTHSMGQQGEPGSPFNAVQLARMGLSPVEIKLLQMSGGSR